MTDEFDALMAEAFGPMEDRAPKPPGPTIIGPDTNDHWALHTLEALAQVAMALDAEPFVCPLVEPEAADFARMLTMGLPAWLAEAKAMAPGGVVEVGSPASMELMAWVRRAAGALADALTEYLDTKEIARYTTHVYLAGHGWSPFQVRASRVLPDDSWRVTEPPTL